MIFINFLPKHHPSEHENKDGYSVTVVIQNVKSDRGKVAIAIFNNSQSFLYEPMDGKRVDIDGQAATATFEGLTRGEYAISVYHDANNNGELDKNIFGAPKEDYNVSNNAKNTFSAPKWEDAKFYLDKDLKIKIKL
jgi:uncharacterized protein (DUF2141 family)